jgi:hypothetical protein
LGLLTKEFAILLLPLFPVAFLLRPDPWRRRIAALAVSAVLTACVVGPWVLHVKAATGSALGGLAQRGKGQALEVFSDQRSWGLREGSTVWEMVHLRGMPSAPFKAIYVASLLYVLLRSWRRRDAGGGMLLLLVLVWIGTFAVFVKLPLTSRRLLPLLPVYSLFAAVLFHDVYELLGRSWRRRSWNPRVASVMGAAGLVGLVWVGLQPAATLGSVKPLRLYETAAPPPLRASVQDALKCLPGDARVLTNGSRLFYFYAKGEVRIAGASILADEDDELAEDSGPKPKRDKKRPKQQGTRAEVRDGDAERQLGVSSALGRIQGHGVSHVVVFNPESRGPVQDMAREAQALGDGLKVICAGRDVVVYALVGP